MARQLRIEYPGALYHVTSRGNGKQSVFRSDHDRKSFLNILEQITGRYRFIILAYCLMDNHYHLVIETQEGNLSEGMRQLNGVYTQRYNRRHTRSGHVFQGRYKAIIVDKDVYLLELVRYVALNPVRAGIVDDPENWAWSSYRATVGKEESPPWLCTERVLGQFSPRMARARIIYRQFVNQGLKRESPWKDLIGQTFLGSKDFMARIQGSFQEDVKEIPRSQRFAGRPALPEILTGVCRTNRFERNEAIRKANGYGYSLKEIANYLGIHYATVSRALVKEKP
ncbi:MAG: transposase [Deltaproteobacteria bacterium]|nr:transposase [Deltaproteobacteria bacterium]